MKTFSRIGGSASRKRFPVSSLLASRVMLACLLSILAAPAFAQTKLKLSAIKPGTERVQLINNGDFQFQGPLVGTNYPFPSGWSSSVDMYANAGSNMVAINSGVVARAQVNSGAAATGFSQTVTLEPATPYVFSGYMWNMGDAVNHVNTVMDMNDAPSEPQIVLSSTDSEAAKGYFVYRSFNTATTGTNVTVRIFYDGFTGTGTAPSNNPVAAQWDNVAITKSVNFVAPQASGSTATLRPIVRITSPANGAFAYASGATLSITANATDLDGTITNVQFFAGTNKVGNVSASPWTAIWSNTVSGTYVLTAVAADNTGATTVSAPVSVSVTTPPQAPALNIQAANSNVILSWSSSGDGMIVQRTSNLLSSASWTKVTNAIQVINSSNVLALPITAGPQFFRLAPEVDAITITGKLLMGYQGWFACPGDGSASSGWVHWFRSQNPIAADATVDFWPDVSELDPDELFSTSMTYPNGAPAKLYSAYNAKTVLRHFKWMRDNHLDGVFLQRFSSGLSDASTFARLNQVAANVRAGADAYRRVFALMYDISGHPTNTLVSALTNDWLYLVNTLQLTNSSRYLRHNGKPVVAVWGFGFSGRQDSPQQAQEVINFFKSAGLTVMGGLPTYWRTLNNDAQSDPAWAAVFRSFDIISPWSVGRYGDIAGADNFRQNLIVPDMAETAASGREYMPVIFPGFSWFNLNGGPLNQIPRNGGTFYWEQAYNAKLSGCNMIYGAMFDEVDEGTAMYKLAPTANEIPAQGSWVPLDIDGSSLPSDWYLRLAGEASRMLRGEIPLQSTIPIAP
ncbi:MAG TPA: Ig-like domain-containing protein [Candidatus Dormibacteraeota bacterium]|nr:Ig-like domain-containing protein [Candidatus Dormibacteraeota bacterium]